MPNIMRASTWILAFLVAATVWADFVQTYVLFAKVNGTLEPLHVYSRFLIKNMAWGYSSGTPKEFLYEDDRAYSSNKFKPGAVVADISQGLFFHKFYTGSGLKLDVDKRLRNFFFYSCRESIGINTIRTVKIYENCVFSEIYFLPYNRTAKAPVKGSYIPKDDVERIPHVFFIEGKKGLEPLYSKTFLPIYSSLIPFNYGNPRAKPLEFYFQEDYAIIESSEVSGYVGTSDGYFGFGGIDIETTLDLDRNMRFQSQRSFSCNDDRINERMIVLDPSPDCFEVEMYLLPYNRTSQRPVEGSYKPSDSNERMTFLNSSFVFFVNVNDTLKPLSYYTEFNFALEKNHGVCFYQKSWTKPVEFTLNNRVAHTQNSNITGFARIYGNTLIFGGSSPQEAFHLGKESRIEGYDFYSCPENETTQRNVIRDLKQSKSCFKVELYLLPYNQTSGRPVKGSYVPKNDSIPVTAIGQQSNESITYIHQKVMTPSGNKSMVVVILPDVHEDPVLENHVGNKLSLPSDFPHVFFRKGKKGWVSLSATYSKVERSINYFSSSKSQDAPLEFTLTNGFAYTQNSTQMYAGFYDSYFGFGVNIKEKFIFDGERKISNRPFYMCKQIGNITKPIVIFKIPYAHCKSLDIYLLPFNRTSARPIDM